MMLCCSERFCGDKEIVGSTYVSYGELEKYVISTSMKSPTYLLRYVLKTSRRLFLLPASARFR